MFLVRISGILSLSLSPLQSWPFISGLLNQCWPYPARPGHHTMHHVTPSVHHQTTAPPPPPVQPLRALANIFGPGLPMFANLHAAATAGSGVNPLPYMAEWRLAAKSLQHNYSKLMQSSVSNYLPPAPPPPVPLPGPPNSLFEMRGTQSPADQWKMAVATAAAAAAAVAAAQNLPNKMANPFSSSISQNTGKRVRVEFSYIFTL